jgi:hypothetical protein
MTLHLFTRHNSQERYFEGFQTCKRSEAARSQYLLLSLETEAKVTLVEE